MAREIIDIGSAANDGTGDDLRTGATKINNNFQELYADVGALQATSGDSIDGIGFTNRGILFEGDSPDDTFQTFFGVVNPTADRTILLPNDSGTVALVSDITDIVDSAYVALLTGVAQDSGATLTIVQANSIDSADAIALIDSAYVNLRVDAPDLTAHAGNIVPSVDSTYDLGDSNYKWKDLWLSGQTIHLGGETLGFNGTSFTFSQPLALGTNNVTLDSSNSYNIGDGFVTGPWRTGTYASSNGGGMLLGGNTIQLATVDTVVTAELHTNQTIFNFGFDSTGNIGTLKVPTVNTAGLASTAGQALFKGKGSISYHKDSNRFNFYDDQGWFSIKRNLIEASDISTTVDSDYVKARATEVDLNTYTVATVPTGSHGKLIFVDDGASGSPCLAVYDSDAGFYKRIALGAQIST